MSGWHDFWQFWVSQQTVPGNIIGDLLIGAATFLIGKYKVAPWLHRRHCERIEQQERHHQQQLDQMRQHHEAMLALHREHHRELLEATRNQVNVPRSTPQPPVPS